MNKKFVISVLILVISIGGVLLLTNSGNNQPNQSNESENNDEVAATVDEITWDGLFMRVDEVYKDDNNLVVNVIVEWDEKSGGDYQLVMPWSMIDGNGKRHQSSFSQMENVYDEHGQPIPWKSKVTIYFRDYEGTDSNLNLTARLKPEWLQADEDHTHNFEISFANLPLNTTEPVREGTLGFDVVIELSQAETGVLHISDKISSSSQLLDTLETRPKLESITDDMGNVYTPSESGSRWTPGEEAISNNYEFNNIDPSATSISFTYVLRAKASVPGVVELDFVNLSTSDD